MPMNGGTLPMCPDTGLRFHETGIKSYLVFEAVKRFAYTTQYGDVYQYRVLWNEIDDAGDKRVAREWYTRKDYKSVAVLFNNNEGATVFPSFEENADSPLFKSFEVVELIED